MKEHIETLIKSAADCSKATSQSNAALHFSQAALNSANAYYMLLQIAQEHPSKS